MTVMKEHYKKKYHCSQEFLKKETCLKFASVLHNISAVLGQKKGTPHQYQNLIPTVECDWAGAKRLCNYLKEILNFMGEFQPSSTRTLA